MTTLWDRSRRPWHGSGGRSWVLEGSAGKGAVCLGLGDSTWGAPHALYWLHRHGQDRRIRLASGAAHRCVQLIPAWHEATRLDPPGDGIRRLVEMRGRPGERPLLFGAHANQDQGARYNPYARVEGH